ncbi:hypothetical protein FB382_002765 [Nocardioides ginsengisegetis]|uniref:Uncharacterized protein n=1 Tax=Nocardioides ginsengisegetis TaxID=661491 RepID=A0A7W3J1L8_9ACTN|nr:hypothetical protein [Nocardioides ginsengisegetis]
MHELPPFHPSRPELVAPVRLDRTGENGPTVGQARGKAWRKISRGFYVPAGVAADDPNQRILEASVLAPHDGAVTGWAALHWLGGAWFDGSRGVNGRRPVVVATAGRTVRERPGIAISEERLDPRDVVCVDGLRVTTAVRSACFEMRYAPSDRAAAVVLSMAAYSDLVSIAEMAAYAAAHSGWTGIPRCRWALGHAVENAWSPPEVLMGLAWQLDAGHPRPLFNVPVFDREGRHIGTPDLIDPEAGVTGEYAGELHLEGQQRAVDLRREADFRRVGLEPVTMVGSDLGDSSFFVHRLDDAYRRARHVPAAKREWTLELPHWWVPTHTVEQRRALDVEQRRLWLRHRRVV